MNTYYNLYIYILTRIVTFDEMREQKKIRTFLNEITRATNSSAIVSVPTKARKLNIIKSILCTARVRFLIKC